MAEDILVPIAFFALVFALMYVYWTTRNKERMALIEKGADPALFKTKVTTGKHTTLKAGLFFVGIAVGILLGNILSMYTELEDVTAYFSMIILFGGFGLLAGYWFQNRIGKL